MSEAPPATWAIASPPRGTDIQAHLAQLDKVRLCRKCESPASSCEGADGNLLRCDHSEAEEEQTTHFEEERKSESDDSNNYEPQIRTKVHRRKESASRFGSIDSEEESPEQSKRELKVSVEEAEENEGDGQPEDEENKKREPPPDVPDSPRTEEDEIEIHDEHKTDGPLLIHLNAADVEDQGNDTTTLPHNVNLTTSSTDHTALQRFATTTELPLTLRNRNPWNVPPQSVLHQPKLCIMDCVQRCKDSKHYAQLDHALSQLLHVARLHKPSPLSGPYLSGSGIVNTIKVLTDVFEHLVVGAPHAITLSLLAGFPRPQWPTLKCLGLVFQCRLLIVLKLVSVLRMCFEELLQSGWESPQRAQIRGPAVFLQTHLRRVCTLYLHVAAEIAAAIARDPSMNSRLTLASPSFRELFPLQMFKANVGGAAAEIVRIPQMEWGCFDWYWSFLSTRLQLECDYLAELVHNPAKLVEEAHVFIKAITTAVRKQQQPSCIPSFAWTTTVYTVRVLTQWVRADPLRFPLLSTAILSLQIFKGRMTWHVPVAVINALAELSLEGGPMGRRACVGRPSLDTELPPSKKTDAHDSLLAFREFYGVYGIFDLGSYNHQVRCVVAEHVLRLQYSSDPAIRAASRSCLAEMEAQEVVRSSNPKKTILPLLKHKANPAVVEMLLSMLGLRLGAEAISSSSSGCFRAPRFAWVKKSVGGSGSSCSVGSSSSSSSSSSSDVCSSGGSLGSSGCGSSNSCSGVDGSASVSNKSSCSNCHSSVSSNSADGGSGRGGSSGNSSSNNSSCSSSSHCHQSVCSSSSSRVCCSSGSGGSTTSSPPPPSSASPTGSSRHNGRSSGRTLKSILSLPHHESELVSHSNSWWRPEPRRKGKRVNWAQSVDKKDKHSKPAPRSFSSASASFLNDDEEQDEDDGEEVGREGGEETFGPLAHDPLSP